MATVEAVQRLLTEGVNRIVDLHGEPSDREAEAFTAFRRAITQASNGKLGTPSELLDDLEPKDVVLRFLFDLHERRRLYRKQIAAMMSILMETGWVAELRRDKALRASIPAELGNLVDLDLVDESMAASQDQGEGDGYPQPSVESTTSDEKPQDSLFPFSRHDVKPVIAPAVAEVLELLQKAGSMLASLDYSAVKKDDATDAFELFRKALLRVTSLSSPEGRNALDSMECKGQILEFLVDFHARQARFRSRVSSVLLKLQAFDDWAAAAQQDPSVRAALKELTDDLSQPTKRLTAIHAGLAINLGAAATAVGKRGGLGALYVRVFAAKLQQDVGNTDALGRLPDPYVRVTLNGRTKRTIVVLNSLEPTWDSEPFIFEVPSVAALVQFDILDTDLMKDHLLGSLTVCAADAPREPGFVTHRLDGRGKGELELEMVFMPAKESPEEIERRKRRSSVHSDVMEGLTSAVEQLEAMPSLGVPSVGDEGWLVMQPGKPSKSFTSQQASCGPLTCPAGHTIEKKKEGLHWFEGWVGYKHGQNCDLCGHSFNTREEARYRCNQHCHYDICEPCFASGQSTASTVIDEA